MAIVLDASVAVAWCIRDEEKAAQSEAVAARLTSESGIVPGIFWYEVRNALINSERRGRLDSEGAGRFLERLAALEVQVDADHSEYETLNMARRHRLTVYDAAYLETSIRREAALATLDEDLAAAANVEGVVLAVSRGA